MENLPRLIQFDNKLGVVLGYVKWKENGCKYYSGFSVICGTNKYNMVVYSSYRFYSINELLELDYVLWYYGSKRSGAPYVSFRGVKFPKTTFKQSS